MVIIIAYACQACVAESVTETCIGSPELQTEERNE